MRHERHIQKRPARLLWALACAALCVFAGVSAFGAAEAGKGMKAVVVEINGEITRGMRIYVENELKRAAEQGAAAVVLRIDTPGGLIVEAQKMQQAISDAPMPVYAFVEDDAISAGVLVALSADRIYMAPGTNIGSAETIPNDEKTLSYWTGELRAAAELRGRDGDLYAAMADKRIAIPGVTQDGMLLNLTAQRAAELGAVDGIAHSALEAASLELSLPQSDLVLETRSMSLPVLFSQFVTSSAVSSILFTLAFLAMLIEIFTPGFGIFGFISIACFGLYFGGGLIAGYSEWWAVLLFAVGVVLLVAEMAVPGFGILGIGGIACIALALFFNARDIRHFLTTLSIALVTCAVAVPILLHISKKAGLMNKLVLSDALTSEAGFVSHEQEESFVGQTGVAVTTLRPAGIVKISEKRIDALSTGDFILKDEKVRVVHHEGGKVLVEKAERE